MAVSDIQSSFGAGELSPALYGRVDLAKYEVGAALMRNFLVDYRGGARYRPGTKFIAACKNSDTPPRLLPFIVSTDASYVLELGDSYIRIYSLGVLVQEVVTPYVQADLSLVKYAQSADVMTLVHPSYPPATLTRTSPTTFVYAAIVIASSIDPPVITSVVGTEFDQFNYGYIVTAVRFDGKEESTPSNPGIGRSQILDETKNYVENIQWTAPAQAVEKYNIYKWGPLKWNNPAPSAWGYIGSSQTEWFTDNNIAPDFTKQAPSYQNPWLGGQLESVSVTAGGSGYNADGSPGHASYIPLTITGDGTGAAGFAVMRSEGDGVGSGDGYVAGAFLTSPGSGYTTASATAVGAGGSGATFSFQISDITPLYPGCVAYYQQRQVFAASTLKPETLVMSRVGSYTNFDTTPISQANDAISLTISSLEVNTIKSMVPVSYGLITFTTGGTFLLNGGSPYAAVTPSSISVQAQASEGANDIIPLRINFDILYIQSKGNRVRDIAFAWQRQSYTGSDISSLAAHLFDDYLTIEWAWSQEPYKTVNLVRDDGVLLMCTYVPDQEIYAWTRHDTQGLFKSVCSIPEGDINAVYVVVQRHVPTDDSCGGGWVNYIERFMPTDCCIYDAWFLDSAVALEPTPGAVDVYITNNDDGTMEVCAPGGGGEVVTFLSTPAMVGDNVVQGFFNYTLPESYVSGDPITVTVNGKAVNYNGARPTQYAFGVWAVTIGGKTLNDLSIFAPSQYYMVGQDVLIYVDQQIDPTTIAQSAWVTKLPARWQNLQTQTYTTSATTYTFTIPGTNLNNGFWASTGTGGGQTNTAGGGTLEWAGPPYTSDSGFLRDTVGAYFAPGGDAQSLLAGSALGYGAIAAGSRSLAAGDTVSIELFTYVSGGVDVGHPSRAQIYEVTVTAGGVTSTIPLDSFYYGMYEFDIRPVDFVAVGQYPVAYYYLATEGTPGPFADVSIGDVFQVGCSKMVVTALADSYHLVGTPLSSFADYVLPGDPETYVPILAGTWSVSTPQTYLTGLNHLEGKTVMALADGLVVSDLVVTSGSVTLPQAASNIIVGLQYVGEVQTLYLNVEGLQRGSMQGKRKLQPAVTLRLDCTAGLDVGIDFEHLSPVVYDMAPYSAPGALFTGDQRHPVFTDWNTEGQICVRQNVPLPATILGIIAEVVPGDTTE